MIYAVIDTNVLVSAVLISHIIEHGIEASRMPFHEPMPDEDDRVFYEIALSTDGSYLVTGNQKHYLKTPIVISPADFIDIVLRQQ